MEECEGVEQPWGFIGEGGRSDGPECGGWYELRAEALAWSNGPLVGCLCVAVRIGDRWCGFAELVVADAEGDEVVDVGGSACLPGVDVVDLAAVHGDLAAGEGAVSVAEADGVALCGGGEASAASEVQDLGLAAEDDGQDLRVAQQPAQLSRRDRGSVGQQARGVGASRRSASCMRTVIWAAAGGMFRPVRAADASDPLGSPVSATSTTVMSASASRWSGVVASRVRSAVSLAAR